jgi:tRNA/tmRNA/rRNA uracil-C5-methylase (TrmA/RlmC/RlmD family)
VILDVAGVGHGGICISHAPDGRAVMVRHALPGEQVRVTVTETKSSYLRADAVEVLRASPHRVVPPCPFAGPGRCGGCDWQHVDLAEQRRLKATVVAEQLARLAGVERDIVVEPVPGDENGLHWRTRMRLAVDPTGRAGLRRHRSHEVEPIDDCLIADRALPVASFVARSWPPDDELELVRGDVETAAGRTWRIPPDGFWQVHPGAADALAEAVLGVARLLPGEHALDLYAGVGLFAGALAMSEPAATVVAVESNRAAVAAARDNLADLVSVTVVADQVDRWLRRTQPTADLVVLDPPRRGAGRAVVAAIAESAASRVVYVACDPAALARDVATFDLMGYDLESVRAFDLFPMTAHVEAVALLRRRPDAPPS